MNTAWIYPDDGPIVIADMTDAKGLRKILIVRGLNVINNGSIISMDDARGRKIKRRFGERVRQLRKQKGLSQEALALICELDRTYIGGVERGERNISLINIYKIAAAFGVPAKDLLDA